ncbi:MAG: zinc-ribbon domain-containing protein, partial [Lachnospiraceae bacterium]|nr:zinc-ribbon domain-containing protein [Lachnospiraceae bacterium]
MNEYENMIVCPCCGTPVPSGSPFCPECGTPLKGPAVTEPKTETPDSPADLNTESTESFPFQGLHFVGGICPDGIPEEDIPDGPDD